MPLFCSDAASCVYGIPSFEHTPDYAHLIPYRQPQRSGGVTLSCGDFQIVVAADEGQGMSRCGLAVGTAQGAHTVPGDVHVHPMIGQQLGGNVRDGIPKMIDVDDMPDDSPVGCDVWLIPIQRDQIPCRAADIG